MLPQNLRSQGPNINRDTFGRRVTKACARCRKRKIKCDLQFPTCGSCALVQAECLGFDAAQGKSRPRSTISHLENQIAQLEIELAQLKSKHASTASYAFSSAVDDLTAKLARTIVEPWKDSSNSTFEGGAILPLASPTFLSQSPLPKFHDGVDEGSNAGNGSEDVYQSTNIASIPRNVIDIMLKNYCETYLPQYPAIEEASLYDSCNKIYLSDGPDHWDFFTVAITLAISANTLIRHDEKRAIAAAGEFWATAKEHLPFVGLENNWQRLQALQLLAHYGLLNPRLVNCSNCASAATRLCIQLGLHRELAANEQERMGIKIVNTRRRLFWTSYSLDAAFHSVLCQPYIWPKHAISTLFPSSSETAPSPTSHVWSLRQIEAEVTLKMYFPSIHPSPSTTTTTTTTAVTSPHLQPQSSSHPQPQNLSSTAFQSWFHITSTTLSALRLQTTKSGLADVLDLQTFRLNRPSPRSPHPSASMRRNALSAAITLTKEYAAMERTGKFFYIWYAAHYLTELWVWVVEGVVVGLEAMRMNADGDSGGNWKGISTGNNDDGLWLEAFETQQLTRTLRTFPHLLRKVALRWPAIQQLAWGLEEVSGPLVQKLEEGGSLRDVARTVDFDAVNKRLGAFAAVPGLETRGWGSREGRIGGGGQMQVDGGSTSQGAAGMDVESWDTALQTESQGRQHQRQHQQRQHQHQQQQQQHYPISTTLPSLPQIQNQPYLLPSYNDPHHQSNPHPLLPLNLSPLSAPPAAAAGAAGPSFDPSWSQSQPQHQHPQPRFTSDPVLNTNLPSLLETNDPVPLSLDQNLDLDLSSNMNIDVGMGLASDGGIEAGIEGGDMFWDLAGLDLDQIFAALLEGREVDVVPTS